MNSNEKIPTIHFDFSNLGTESLLEVIRALKRYRKEYTNMTISEIERDIQDNLNKHAIESHKIIIKNEDKS